jgi:arylsulfatase A-like enzyme
MFYGDFGDEWSHPPNKRLADHDPEGVMLVAGPDQTATDITADIVDIAPTLLALHDLPVVDSMDGTVIKAIAGSSDVQSVPAELYDHNKQSLNRSGTEEEAVKDRLSDLGYL